ncbi:hypothetical protein GCM10010971_26470 [Silvimonas amylolytica]|uniref:Uncharacterized protein n=1 Tax=Silvimonas amylolytica TaxID=449663 RepID=A0ABQ2PND0_9NEIS|nr:hypothetical protein GCM10010971_26470 [Silvimonas amylolytica]
MQFQLETVFKRKILGVHLTAGIEAHTDIWMDIIERLFWGGLFGLEQSGFQPGKLSGLRLRSVAIGLRNKKLN